MFELSKNYFKILGYFMLGTPFEKALQHFKQLQSKKLSHDSIGRFLLDTKYFNFLEKYPEKGTFQEIKEFLNLLTDPKNEFVEPKKTEARDAIIGLCRHLGKYCPLDHSIRSRTALMLEKMDRAKQASMPSSSQVEQLSTTMMTLEEILGTTADVLIDQLSERVPLTFFREHDALRTPLPSFVATDECKKGQKQKYKAHH